MAQSSIPRNTNHADGVFSLAPDVLRHVFGPEFAAELTSQQRHGLTVATKVYIPSGKSGIPIAIDNAKKANLGSASEPVSMKTGINHASHRSKSAKNSTDTPLVPILVTNVPEFQPPSQSPVELLGSHMEQKLEALVASNVSLLNHGRHMNGRLGPKVVKLDYSSHAGSFIVSQDRLGLNSQSNFASMRANVCVFKGKWQYEVQLNSKGIMQIGWATFSTKFTNEKGVGDSADSYGFDGNRMRKWNVSASAYGGQAWKNGDVIGCSIDLDNGVIEYYRNGASLGQAFKDIHRGPGIAYFPAVSLTYSESLVANFGASPFLFPVPQFEPLQMSKLVEDTKSVLLLAWLEKIVDIYPSSSSQRIQGTDSKSTILIANQLFKLLEENIRSAFVIEHTLLPFLATHVGLPADIKSYDASTFRPTATGKLPRLMDLMWVYFEEVIMHNILERLSIILMNYVKSHTYSFAYPYQTYSIKLLSGLVEHRATRRYFLHHLLFDKTKIANFLYVRPLDEDTMKTIITTPWWPGKTPDGSTEARAYEHGCRTIHQRISHLEDLQVTLLRTLLTNSDGKETRPSSRAVFLKQMRKFIEDTLRHGPGSLHPISKPMCTFFRLLKTVSVLWTSEVGPASAAGPVLPDVPPTMFYDNSIDYYDLDRVGGLINHLYRTYHVETSQALGVEDYYTPPDPNTLHQRFGFRIFLGPFGPESSTEGGSSGTGTAGGVHQDTPFPSVLGLLPGVQAVEGPQTRQTGTRSAPAIMAPPNQDEDERSAQTATTDDPVSETQSLVDLSFVPVPEGALTAPTNAAQGQTSQQHEISTQIADRNLEHLLSLPDFVPNGQGPLPIGSIPASMSPPNDQGAESNAEDMSIDDTSSVSLVSGEDSQNSTTGRVPLNPFQRIEGLFGPDVAFTLLPGGLFGFRHMGRQIRPKVPHEMEISRHRGAMNIRTSLRELLDDCILIFVASVSAHVEKVVGIRANVDSYIEAIAEAKETLTKDSVSLYAAQKAELRRSIEIFEEKLTEEVKHMTWIKSALFTPERQALVVALLRTILTSLKRSSELGLLFRFTPDVYISAMVKLTWFITTQMHPTVSYQQIPGFAVLCRDVAEFVALHFMDNRIALSETKDTLTQALSKLICDRTMLTAIETMPEASQLELVKTLLKPYDKRAWAQSNWMLVRIWQGNGFGFQYLNCASARKSYQTRGVQDEFGIATDLPPTPSPILQRHVKAVLLGDQQLASIFLHSLLNQLNWSFSEFIGLMQEINTATSQSENVHFDHRQLKVCCTCFELTQALLRVVEMIVSIASPVITDFSRENAQQLLERLCMLLSQVLNRVASRSGTFGQVLDLELTGLDTVTYYAMLTSVAGVLVALLHEEVKINERASLPITKTILLEPSMQINCLAFLIGESQVARLQQNPFTLRAYVPEDITPAEIHSLEVTITHLNKWNGEFQREFESISDDDICTICYASPKSVTMLPCDHRSCRACISHHLLTKHLCFFCKRKIEKVVADDGTVVYNETAGAPDDANPHTPL